MEAFKIGDFIRLKSMSKYDINRLIGININVFKIEKIEKDHVEVEDCKDKILFADIDPIPINGIDDINIYYDPIVCASYVAPNEPAPICNTDYSYYFDAFKKNIYREKNFQELVQERKLEFVHEVQHFLIENFHDSRLFIHKHL